MKIVCKLSLTDKIFKTNSLVQVLEYSQERLANTRYEYTTCNITYIALELELHETAGKLLENVSPFCYECV